MIDRRDLLRRWLRGKGCSIQEVAMALEWYDHEVSQGRKPTDAQVFSQADMLHSGEVSSVTTNAPIPSLIVKYELTWKIVLYSFIGSTIGGTLAWALAQMLLLQ